MAGRRFKVEFDLGPWALPSSGGGGEAHVVMTIDEAKCEALAQKAMARHDGRIEISGGAIVLQAKVTKKPGDQAAGKSRKKGRAA